ncbi:MAG: hypothetical protein WCC39_17965 [Telluria sp.]
MIRAICFAALYAAAVFAAQATDAPGFCKSMCGSERQACKATAHKMTGNDDLLERSTVEKNPYANTASHTQGQSEQARAADNASFQRRKSEREGACEDTYARCTRACSVQDKARGGS